MHTYFRHTVKEYKDLVLLLKDVLIATVCEMKNILQQYISNIWKLLLFFLQKTYKRFMCYKITHANKYLIHST